MARHEEPSRWAVLAIILAVVLIPLNSTMIAVGLEPVAQALRVPEPSVVWVITAYLVVMAALQPISGKLGDLFGRRRLLLLGLFIFLFCSVAAASLPNLLALILFRSGQALGGALVVPGAMALLRQLFRGESLRHALGTVGLVQGMGAALGPLVGAALIHLGGWTYMFWINVPIVALALMIGAKHLPHDAPSGRRPIDYWGALSLAGFLALFALSVPHQLAHFSATQVLFIVLALVLLAVFFWSETHSQDPVVRFAIFRRPPVINSNLAILATNFFMYSTLLYLPVYLSRHGDSTTTTGLLLFVFSFAMSLMSYLGGRIGRLLGPRRIISVAFSFDLLVVLWYVGLSHFPEMAYLLPGLIIAGIGAGIGTVTMQATILESVNPGMAGTASGIYSTFRYIGSITASAVVSLMVVSPSAHIIILTAATLLGFLVLSGFPIHAKEASDRGLRRSAGG